MESQIQGNVFARLFNGLCSLFWPISYLLVDLAVHPCFAVGCVVRHGTSPGTMRLFEVFRPATSREAGLVQAYRDSGASSLNLKKFFRLLAPSQG